MGRNIVIILGLLLVNVLALSITHAKQMHSPNTISYPPEIIEELSGHFVENDSHFKSDYFKRFVQKPFVLELDEGISKRYLFPTFYGNVTSIAAVFMCSYDAAQALLPTKDYKPVSMGFGRALVIISTYHYGQVHGMRPYNEVAIVIPAVPTSSLNIPGVNLIFQKSNMHGYVAGMAVTSLENKIRGVKIWGLPKIVRSIELMGDEEVMRSALYDTNGDTVFELDIPRVGKMDRQITGYAVLSVKDDKTLLSEFTVAGDMLIKDRLSAMLHQGTSAFQYLKIGRSPEAEMLRRLEIRPIPIRTQILLDGEGTYDLPLE